MLFNLLSPYNPKLDYLICKNIAGGFDDSCNELLIRKCYFRKTSWTNKNEYLMCLVRDFFENNDVLSCSEKEVILFISSVTKIKLKLQMINFLLNSNDVLEKKIIVLAKILEQYNCFERDFILRFMVFILFLQEKRKLLIPYNSLVRKLKISALKENENEITFYLRKLMQKTLKMNTPHSIEINRDVIPNLLKYKDSFKKITGCQNLGIFGSFSLGTDNEYSDLDLVVLIKEDIDVKLIKELSLCYWKNIIPLEIDIKIVKEDKLNDFLTPAMLETLKIL